MSAAGAENPNAFAAGHHSGILHLAERLQEPAVIEALVDEMAARLIVPASQASNDADAARVLDEVARSAVAAMLSKIAEVE